MPSSALGVQALNRCTEVVAVAEKRIGEEVERGRAEGSVLKARENRRWKSPGRECPPG